MQANCITFMDMLAYSQLYNVKLTQWEINALCQLDNIALTDPIKLKKAKDGS